MKHIGKIACLGVAAVVVALVSWFSISHFKEISATDKSIGMKKVVAIIDLEALDVSFAEVGSETSDEVVLDIVEDSIDYVNDIVQYSRDICTSVPLILDSSGHWIDQNGNTMAEADAIEFFLYNEELEHEILSLNRNNCYATKLYSTERQDYLDNYNFVGSKVALDDEKISTTCLRSIYANTLAKATMDDKSLMTLSYHFKYNGAVDDVKDARADLLKTRSSKKHATYSGVNDRYIIDRLFFTCLAELTISGKISNDSNEVSSIPVLLSNDGTWYDQHLNVMDDSDVEAYCKEYAEEAGHIIWMNLTCNPFLTADKLNPELYESLQKISTRGFHLSYANNYKAFLPTLNEVAADLPSQESFTQLYATVCPTGDVDPIPSSTPPMNDDERNDKKKVQEPEAQKAYSDGDKIMKQIKELRDLNTYEREAMKLYGFDGRSDDLAGYLFVTTLAQAIENDTF